jgi:hypothetical protein
VETVGAFWGECRRLPKVVQWTLAILGIAIFMLVSSAIDGSASSPRPDPGPPPQQSPLFVTQPA